MHPAGQPLSPSNSAPSFKREFAAPDPADHGACACFKMCWKAFKASSFHHPSPATALQLQQMKLKFYQRLNSLNQTILQQACAFSKHLVSCTSMVNTFANLVRVSSVSIHLSQPLHCNEDCAPFGQNSTSPNPASCIPASHSLLSCSHAHLSSSSHTEAISQSHDNLSMKSVSVTLPWLWGYFNKPKQKLEHDRCGWLPHLPSFCFCPSVIIQPFKKDIT